MYMVISPLFDYGFRLAAVPLSKHIIFLTTVFPAFRLCVAILDCTLIIREKAAIINNIRSKISSLIFTKSAK